MMKKWNVWKVILTQSLVVSFLLGACGTGAPANQADTPTDTVLPATLTFTPMPTGQTDIAPPVTDTPIPALADAAAVAGNTTTIVDSLPEAAPKALTATVTPTPKPTRNVPKVPLKFPPDGTVVNSDDNDSGFQIDATVSDPNYSRQGMSAMAFQVIARVVDPNFPKGKINSVDFTVYASEEDYQNRENPLYRHTEKNAPFCIFSDSNGKCNVVKAEKGKKWPKSDDQSIRQKGLADGVYLLNITVHGGQDNGMFWDNGVEFTLKVRR